MKTMWALIILLLSINSFAESLELSCQEVPRKTQGVFGIYLNSMDDKDLYAIQASYWGFKYSSARLECSTYYVHLPGKEPLQCIGYNTAGGKIEISVSLNSGKITAKVHNIGFNIYAPQTEGMILPCKLVK